MYNQNASNYVSITFPISFSGSTPIMQITAYAGQVAATWKNLTARGAEIGCGSNFGFDWLAIGK